MGAAAEEEERAPDSSRMKSVKDKKKKITENLMESSDGVYLLLIH